MAIEDIHCTYPRSQAGRWPGNEATLYVSYPHQSPKEPSLSLQCVVQLCPGGSPGGVPGLVHQLLPSALPGCEI